MIKGRHLPTAGDCGCWGCLPALAADGALICTRCLQRLRAALADSPDLCAHLRSMIDPLKSGWNFDRERGSRLRAAEAPAPVNVDLIDAGNDIITTLSWWATFFGDDTTYRVEGGFPSTTTPEEAYSVAKWAADYLINNLQRISNDSWVVMFSRAVIDWPTDEREWTIRKALATFPMESRATWSARPCPSCDLRTVRVTPPRREGVPVEYVCRGCGWVPPRGEEELWEMYFNEGAAA